MYIQRAKIEHIRSIEKFEIEFRNPAGWHVLIGDNGSGKSTIIRSIALALIGTEQAQALRQNWSDWLKERENRGNIEVSILQNSGNPVPKSIVIEKKALTLDGKVLTDNGKVIITVDAYEKDKSEISEWLRIRNKFLSAAYGPYRRFEGGSPEWNDLFKNPSYGNLVAHLSVFDESVALTEPIGWLKDLNYKSLEENVESKRILENLKKLINSEDEDGSFLQHNAKLESISSEGVFFKDGNNTIISVNQMSDGYRSILSMTFELMRQLIRVYGSESVFKNIEKGEMFIDLPGVVLVDEIDAHLHPTWQTSIGHWFLKFFPKLQFIVTTHSPLICRAAEKGSIWRLAAPGSEEKSGEVTGLDRKRLIYGNILDAYGTEVFGEDVSISQDSIEKQEELVKLSKKKMLDSISSEEEERLENLRKVFTTDAQIEL